MTTTVLREHNVAPADPARQALMQGVYAKVVNIVRDADFARENPHAAVEGQEQCRIMHDSKRGDVAEIPVSGVTAVFSIDWLLQRLHLLHRNADARFKLSTSERGGSNKLILTIPLAAGVVPQPARDATDSIFSRFFTEPSVFLQILIPLLVLLVLLAFVTLVLDESTRTTAERRIMSLLNAWAPGLGAARENGKTLY
jgi:hypothetical protein